MALVLLYASCCSSAWTVKNQYTPIRLVYCLQNFLITYAKICHQTNTDMNTSSLEKKAVRVEGWHLQRTTIDMPDFGKDGALTGLITADVNEKDPLIHIATVEKSNESINLLDQVINNVNLARANVGAVINRLNHGIDNLTNVSINTAESRSKIQDTDYAQASSEVARTQIIQQAATAILAQANANQQYVMKLLQG